MVVRRLAGLFFAGLGVALVGGCGPSASQSHPLPVDPHELTLTFSGDVMQHLPQVTAARQPDGTYDYHPVFQHIKPFWEAADFAVVNLETTLAEPGRSYTGYPRFASPQAVAGALADAGVDVVALANNHCCDRGAYGIRTTVQTLDSLGLISTGVYLDSLSAARYTVLRKYGFRVGLLNFTYDTNGMPVPRGMVVNGLDTVDIVRQIKQIRNTEQLTHLILFVHWGQEYTPHPGWEQRDVARVARRAGADLVVGSHPHVVQPAELEEGALYSLGNFVSNQRDRYRDGGISIRVTLRRGAPRPHRVEFLPHWVWVPEQREGVRHQYYVVPAYIDGRDIGMNSAEYELFMRSLEDNRRVVGAIEEAVL